MTNSLVILNETTNELLLFVRPDSKKKENSYLHMRFEKNNSVQAIYHAIKIASSLRYDFGHPSVKIEINGIASNEMSCVASTKLFIK
jgi:hypothetical protein